MVLSFKHLFKHLGGVLYLTPWEKKTTIEGMPRRTVPLVSGEYYHVFNRSINKEPIFVKRRDSIRSMEALSYYRFVNPPVRLSYFLSSSSERRQEIMRSLEDAPRLIDIIAFVFMPNHFHLLLKQLVETGISKFLAQLQNSYTRYFTTKYDRGGHLFQGQFKSVRIEDEEQLLHVHRYIHLNPYTSFVVKSLDELEKYPYSSFPEYLRDRPVGICNTEVILSHFSTTTSYKKFIFDQADYQRELDRIKHLVLE